MRSRSPCEPDPPTWTVTRRGVFQAGAALAAVQTAGAAAASSDASTAPATPTDNAIDLPPPHMPLQLHT
ncbi:hypothetical protein E5CHR_04550 [Variovorax sp. PBL-E5]|nr:hypothetical protein [Variovorax sp. PBL-E5]VTU37356.1 hypothetical protein E5CHR_04550 [Variovorax sp. PBL-E5]